MRPPTLYDLAKAYVDSVEWNESHPGDTASEWDVEMRVDLLREYFDQGKERELEVAYSVIRKLQRLLPGQRGKEPGFTQDEIEVLRRCGYGESSQDRRNRL